MRKITVIIIFSMLFLSGCDVLMEEILSYADFRNLLYAPIDQDEVLHVAGNGKDSYYPMVEGFVWKYAGDFERSREAEVRITEVSPNSDDHSYSRILIENIDGTEGSLELGEGYTHGRNSNFLESQMIMVAGNFPTFHIDDRYESLLGSTHTYSGNSNGYPAEATITYGSQLTDISTPRGKEFKDCIHIRYEVDFPEGYDQDWYHEKIDIYMAKGVGYVYVINECNTGEVERLYVTNHSSFGETIRFFDDDSNTLLKDPEVYVDGELIQIPESSKPGFELKEWTDGTNNYQPGDLFTMPDADVDLYAVWEEIV